MTTKQQFTKIESIWKKIRGLQNEVNALWEAYLDETDSKLATRILKQRDKKCSQMLEVEVNYCTAIRSFISYD